MFAPQLLRNHSGPHYTQNTSSKLAIYLVLQKQVVSGLTSTSYEMRIFCPLVADVISVVKLGTYVNSSYSRIFVGEL